MIKLKGMTWDHERGYGPLLAATEQFRIKNPEITIDWDRRSLKDFGDYPVDKLAMKYDLILIDHPHVGICSEQGVLLPLNEWIDPRFLEEQRLNSVGASYDSYHWQGHQWALAVDAAAQVSAYREDLLRGAQLPRTWRQVVELAESLPPTMKIGFPLCPTDAICSYITLCAQIGGDDFFDAGNGIHTAVGEEAADILLMLLPYLHPISLNSNPIQILNVMIKQNDEIPYVPLLFGYSNYSRKRSLGHLIHYTNIPSVNGIPKGSIVGGVGMAVSSFSKNMDAAVKFVVYAASRNIQKTVYYHGGGQPGHRMAWIDAEINRDSNSFFEHTLETMDLSYLRPRHKQFPQFQERAGEALHACLQKSQQGNAVSSREIVETLNKLYHILV